MREGKERGSEGRLELVDGVNQYWTLFSASKVSVLKNTCTYTLIHTMTVVLANV